MLLTIIFPSHLNPGGYIELYETNHPLASDDGTLPEDSPLLTWSQLCLEASTKLGVPMDCGLHHEQRLKDAGFVNVVRKDFIWPINSWPKDPKMKEIGKSTSNAHVFCGVPFR